MLDISGNETVCYPIANKNATVVGSLVPRDYDKYNVSADIKKYDPMYGRLQLTYEQNQKCPFTVSNRTASLNIEMFCDYYAKTTVIEKASLNPDMCSADIIVKSTQGCYDFSVNPLFRWIDKQYIFLGAAMILVGLVLGLLGKKQFKVSVCMIGALVFTLAATLFLFTVFLSRDSPTATGWIIFGVSAFVGIFVGLTMAYLFRVGTAVAAAWGGVSLALILYNSFVYKIDNNSQVVFWIFVISMGIICGVLTLWFFWPAIIIATSIAGAYLVMRGISLYAGGFPGEMEIIDEIKNGKFDGMPASFYGYMAGFFVLSILFIVWQFKKFGSHSEIDKDGQKQVTHHFHRIGGKKGYY